MDLIEDKSKTGKMWWCVTTVNRMLHPAKSPWSANPECVTTVLQSANESTQVNSKKVNTVQISAQLDHALTKVNAGQTFCKTLAAATRPSAQPYRNSSFFFTRVGWKCLLRSSYYIK